MEPEKLLQYLKMCILIIRTGDILLPINGDEAALHWSFEILPYI